MLRSWVTDQSVSVDWRNRWTTGFSHIEEFKRFEKDFRNRQTELEIGYNTRSYESVRGGFEFGRNFDADFRLWTATATYTVTEQLAAEYELQRLELDPEETEDAPPALVPPRAPSRGPRPTRPAEQPSPPRPQATSSAPAASRSPR